MTVTIKVPKKRLNPIFRFGFFISPAIKVTLFHASLLKIEPTIEAAMAPKIATPKMGVVLLSDAIVFISHAFAQLASQILAFDANKKPNPIKPNKEANLVMVKVDCIILPPCTPLVLI